MSDTLLGSGSQCRFVLVHDKSDWLSCLGGKSSFCVCICVMFVCCMCMSMCVPSSLRFVSVGGQMVEFHVLWRLHRYSEVENVGARDPNQIFLSSSHSFETKN